MITIKKKPSILTFKAVIMWGISPHVHPSYSHFIPPIRRFCPQQRQQWKSPHLSTLDRGKSVRAARGAHEDSRQPDCGLCWAQRPSNDHNTLFISTLCFSAAHTGPVDIISLWCFGSVAPVSLSPSLSGHSLSFFHRTHSKHRVRAQWPIDHCWCYLCFPWGLSLGLFCCCERDPHILTEPYPQNLQTEWGPGFFCRPTTCTRPGTRRHGEDLWSPGAG